MFRQNIVRSCIPLFVFFALFSTALSRALDEELFIIFVMLFLAEPHFAASWPYIFDKSYRELFRKNWLLLIAVPILIVMTAISCFFTLGLEIYSYIFLLANLYHVNRQSLGMLKLNGLSRSMFQKANIDCHVPSVVFLAAHFFIETNPHSEWIAAFLLAVTLAYSFFRLTDFGLNKILLKKNNLVLILFIFQMNLIWFPLAIFGNPLLAMAVGVSIHYLQYLFITVRLFSFENRLRAVLIFIVAYTLLMTYVQSSEIPKFPWLFLIASIPQLLHFYLDGHFWRMNTDVIRDRISPILIK